MPRSSQEAELRTEVQFPLPHSLRWGLECFWTWGWSGTRYLLRRGIDAHRCCVSPQLQSSSWPGKCREDWKAGRGITALLPRQGFVLCQLVLWRHWGPLEPLAHRHQHFLWLQTVLHMCESYLGFVKTTLITWRVHALGVFDPDCKWMGRSIWSILKKM